VVIILISKQWYICCRCWFEQGR